MPSMRSASFFDILDGFDHFDAAALAAAAGMDLRLHHPDRAGQAFRRLDRFFDREGGLAVGHGRAKAAQDFLGLIFMDVHGSFRKGAWVKCAAQ